MRIAITGIAGFIGSNLADRLLVEGHAVIGIDNLSYGKQEQIPVGAEFVQEDIREKGIVSVFQDVDVVFHLAAKNCIPDCQDDPLETASINVIGSVNVFEAAKKAKVRKVIYAESSALYEGILDFPSTEKNVKPETFYSISKLCEALFVEGYHRYFGLCTTGLRYFNVYGPRQDYRRSIPPVMSAFIIKLMNGEAPIIYGTGEKRKDFIHVDDINEFHLQCLTDTRTDNNVYNLGTGKNYSIQDIYRLISDILARHIEPIYRDELTNDAQVTLADISAAAALGWQPHTSLREGICGMIEYLECEGIISKRAHTAV